LEFGGSRKEDIAILPGGTATRKKRFFRRGLGEREVKWGKKKIGEKGGTDLVHVSSTNGGNHEQGGNSGRKYLMV